MNIKNYKKEKANYLEKIKNVIHQKMSERKSLKQIKKRKKKINRRRQAILYIQIILTIKYLINMGIIMIIKTF